MSSLVAFTVNNTGLNSTSVAIAADAVFGAYGPTQDNLQQAQGTDITHHPIAA